MSGGVKKIAQVAVGAVIGFVQGGPVGAAIGAGMAFYMAEQQEKLNTKSPMRDNEPSEQTVRSSKAPARFILGRVSTGGVLVWAQEQAGDQTDGEWLHLVYVLCEGPVDALENIYLGEEEIATYGEHATYELVVNPTQVNAFLKANCPDWKDEQIGRGLSFVRLSLKYSAEKFPSGIPDARFIVRGRNDIYDPRSGTAVYTENTALHILWYLRNRCGVPDDEIVFETFASGANICDESVANPDNTTSPRYRSSCVIGADEQRTNVLQKLEAACGGRTLRVGGRWMFQAGAYYGPYDFEITEDMVVGTITGSTEPTNDAAINTVRGTFIDTSQSWTETDYPEVSIAEWVIEDGGEAAETLSFSYVTDAYQAQRLANIELRRRRAGGTISVPMNFLGYNCRPGRAVRVNLPSLNILGEFIVTNWSMGADQGCTAQLQQYDAAQFDDAVGQPYNPIGFINLPAGGLGSPTGLAWTPDGTAEVTQGVLSWLQPAGVVTSYAVTVRKGGTAVQAQQVPATTLQLPIAGLPSGSYTMSVAALGPLTRSGEASITVSIDGPPIPESCVVQATIDTITLIPGNTLHGLNGGTYEYFFSTNPQATEGEYLGQGLSLTHTGLAFATNYAYFVRSKNAYGVSAFLKVVASTSTDVENMLDALKDKIEGGQLAPALREEIELISGPPSTPGSVNARIQDLGEQVAEAQQDLQQQIDTIADLADSMPYKPDQAYTAGQGVLGENGKLYQAKADVPAGNPPPNATFWTDIGQAVQTANGLAARVTTVETKVTEQDGKLAAESTRIDGVQSSLATTNQNVNAAQQAAQDAATLAGGKGKVIVQSAAPAAADRLAQNLWIDTTGNANTPKRWNGSAWSAVTDKVATDAAAAAANALTVAQTKADATVVDSLSSKVNQQGDTLTSQGQALTGVQNSLTTTNQNVTAAQQAAQAASDAAGAKGKVLYQSTAPAVADRLAQNLWIDTTSNANTPKRWNGTAWVAVTDKVATDAAAAAQLALAQVATKAEASALQTLDTEVKSHGTTLTSQGAALTQISNQIGNVGGDNLLANSSFEELATASRAKYWNVGATATGTVTSMVDSPLAQSTKAQRVEHPALPAGGYVDLAYGGDNVSRPKARPGAQYALSVFARGTPGVAFRQYLQFRDAAGAVLSAPVAMHTLTADYGRFVLLATAPADTVSVTVWAGRMLNGGSTTISAWSEMDNVQFQEGAVATAYAPSTEQSAAVQAAATQALQNRVEQTEAGLSSQGAAITSLDNSLTTTNQNVTAAQQAAQAAATAAGAKGEVIYGAAAPAADKRLAQNLWIDTTGNANTPKRWNGSAWVAVTDKVATDAAAAAASALTQVATKAEASVVQALSTTVGQQGTTLTSQGQSITELRNTIGGIGAGGLDAAPGATWQFDTSVEGWSATNATLTAGTGSMTITATANDPNLVSPIVSINGALYSRIKVKITRRAGAATDWDSSLFYQTAGHGFSGSYIARAANPNIAVGESAIVEWDMANLFAGGNDWITSTITRLRIDIGALSGGAFEIDWIAVGRLGPSASAAALQQVSTNVTQQGEQLTAQASRLDGLYVQVNPEMEGDSSGLAGATGGLVGVWTEQSARVEDGIAMGRQVEAVQAQMGQTNASVQQVSEVMADINGRVSAQTTLKVETNQGGRKVVSGIAIGSNGEEGEILLMAQRLAVIDSLNGQTILPFVVEGGQIFINQAVINTAFIQQIVAGMTIRSAALNAQGLPLLEINFAAGTFTLRGQDANGSTLLNNGGLYVYDANGIERTAVGRLT
ncbi:phage tail tip fiber protein [Pseudomonas sp. C5pp]|uniref:phage tail tip fiber protein n=1 Tax=Pseudomonas sp. C5pp TaxID=1586081 RepID=UPI00068CF4AE